MHCSGESLHRCHGFCHFWFFFTFSPNFRSHHHPIHQHLRTDTNVATLANSWSVILSLAFAQDTDPHRRHLNMASLLAIDRVSEHHHRSLQSANLFANSIGSFHCASANAIGIRFAHRMCSARFSRVPRSMISVGSSQRHLLSIGNVPLLLPLPIRNRCHFGVSLSLAVLSGRMDRVRSILGGNRSSIQVRRKVSCRLNDSLPLLAFKTTSSTTTLLPMMKIARFSIA